MVFRNQRKLYYKNNEYWRLAKTCLFGQSPQTVGKIKYICASHDTKHGKPLKEQELIEVELILDNGIEELKETGTERWRSPNIGATNKINFNSLPGGYRNDCSDFYNINNTAHYCFLNEIS